MANIPGSNLLPWINRALECLWLLIVFSVPLIFFSQDYSTSEAAIANIEIPKVALLRALTGLILVLWTTEWAITSHAFERSFTSITLQNLARHLNFRSLYRSRNTWLRMYPSRWLAVAALIFIGSTFISTALSGSIENSIWGEIPGQDSYSAYSVASWGILFGVIATHLKTKTQLVRIICVMVLMGVLVGVYASFQHFGHDFLNLTESTGGGTKRVTVFMGNTIFAGAVLAMTIPLTLMVAAINFKDENWGNWKPIGRLGQLGRDGLLTVVWASLLSVQFLGIMFTFSRGPWSGAGLALFVFIFLVLVSLGLRMFVRTGLVLSLAILLTGAFLLWQGSLVVVNGNSWLALILVTLGVSATIGTLVATQRYGPRTVLLVAAIGSVLTVASVSIFAPSGLTGRILNTSAIETETNSRVIERISSINSWGDGGLDHGRRTHWEVSWALIKDRPWFEFDNLSFSWLRPLIGYGPDLFRYTYLLKSPAEGPELRPLEPDHAHNFFLHQTVEQGILGGLASLCLFFSVFGVVAYRLLFKRNYGNPLYRLLLFGLAAIIAGRFLEMLIGVARISDLTILWAVFGLFVASANFDDELQETGSIKKTSSDLDEEGSNHRQAARPITIPFPGKGTTFRLALVVIIACGVGTLIWQKNINYVRASINEGRAFDHFRRGELNNTLLQLNKAISLAPGVPSYYNNRAQVFLTYQLQPERFLEPNCNQQTDLDYLVCLKIKSLESNLQAVEQQKFNYRSRIMAGDSAFNLGLFGLAAEFYSDGTSMVPHAYETWTSLAESQINGGLYDIALASLNQSFEITQGTTHSVAGLLLNGRALQRMGSLDEAKQACQQSLSLSYTSKYAQVCVNLLREIDKELGVYSDIDHYSREINTDPQNPIPYYFRGLEYLRTGNVTKAKLDMETSYSLGLRLPEVLANRGYARLKTGERNSDIGHAMDANPSNLSFVIYRGEYQTFNGDYELAIKSFDRAIASEFDIGSALLGRSKVLIALGRNKEAKSDVSRSNNFSLQSSQHYLDRGEIHAFFGDFDLAILDLDKAIDISPNRPEYYNARAKVHASMGNLQFAKADIDIAVQTASIGWYIPSVVAAREVPPSTPVRPSRHYPTVQPYKSPWDKPGSVVEGEATLHETFTPVPTPMPTLNFTLYPPVFTSWCISPTLGPPIRHYPTSQPGKSPWDAPGAVIQGESSFHGVSPTPRPLPTATPVPSPTPFCSPRPSPTPVPTSVPIPTPTRTPIHPFIIMTAPTPMHLPELDGPVVFKEQVTPKDELQPAKKLSEYYVNRGIIYHLLEEFELSRYDLALADSLDEAEVPKATELNISYFSAFTNPAGKGVWVK